jgi:hypothetical protein
MPPPKDFHAYCDESCTSGERFLVYGAVMTSAERARSFEEMMVRWRDDNRMHGELKWTKCSKKKLPEYKRFVDLFFDWGMQKGVSKLRFAAAVFDTQAMDHKKHNPVDPEIGFYKLYYKFLLHRFGRTYAHDETNRLYVFMDQRSTRYNIRGLRLILDNGIVKEKSFAFRGVVRVVEPRDSSACSLLQLADVLMGGIGWEFNKCGTRPNAAPHKIELAAYIAKRARLKTLGNSSVRGAWQYTIWRWRFQDELKQRPDA